MVNDPREGFPMTTEALRAFVEHYVLEALLDQARREREQARLEADRARRELAQVKAAADAGPDVIEALLEMTAPTSPAARTPPGKAQRRASVPVRAKRWAIAALGALGASGATAIDYATATWNAPTALERDGKAKPEQKRGRLLGLKWGERPERDPAKAGGR